jgi:hypothetical protein
MLTDLNELERPTAGLQGIGRPSKRLEEQQLFVKWEISSLRGEIFSTSLFFWKL